MFRPSEMETEKVCRNFKSFSNNLHSGELYRQHEQNTLIENAEVQLPVENNFIAVFRSLSLTQFMRMHDECIVV